MTALLSLYNALADRLNRADWLLPTLARFLFAAILLVYYIKSALTKLDGDAFGFWTFSSGAYYQIFPRVFEAAGFDSSALNIFQKLVVMAGTWSEFLLPALIILGLFTRLAALGMIAFVVLQSLTDVYGLGLGSELGAWFDGAPDSIILDQRALWIFILLTMVLKGGGPISIDHLLKSRQ